MPSLWLKRQVGSNWLTLGMCSCKKVINHSEALGSAWRQCARLLILHGKPYPSHVGWGGRNRRRGGLFVKPLQIEGLLYWENLPEIWNTNYKWGGGKLFKKGFSVYNVESDCPPSQATVVLGSTVVFPPLLCKRYQWGCSTVNPFIERWSKAWDSHLSTQMLATIWQLYTWPVGGAYSLYRPREVLNWPPSVWLLEKHSSLLGKSFFSLAAA